MPAPYYSLLRPTEDVLESFVKYNGIPADVNLYTSMNILDEPGMKPDCIQIIATGSVSATPEVQMGDAIGNRIVSASIACITERLAQESGGIEIASVRERHDWLSGQVLDMFYCPNIIELLNAQGVPGIEIVQVMSEPSEDITPQQHGFRTVYGFEIMAATKQ